MASTERKLRHELDVAKKTIQKLTASKNEASLLAKETYKALSLRKKEVDELRGEKKELEDALSLHFPHGHGTTVLKKHNQHNNSQLEAQILKLQSEKHALQNQYSNLENDHQNLKESHKSLNDQHDELKTKSSSTLSHLTPPGMDDMLAMEYKLQDLQALNEALSAQVGNTSSESNVKLAQMTQQFHQVKREQVEKVMELNNMLGQVTSELTSSKMKTIQLLSKVKEVTIERDNLLLAKNQNDRNPQQEGGPGHSDVVRNLESDLRKINSEKKILTNEKLDLERKYEKLRADKAQLIEDHRATQGVWNAKYQLLEQEKLGHSQHKQGLAAELDAAKELVVKLELEKKEGEYELERLQHEVEHISELNAQIVRLQNEKHTYELQLDERTQAVKKGVESLHDARIQYTQVSKSNQSLQARLDLLTQQFDGQEAQVAAEVERRVQQAQTQFTEDSKLLQEELKSAKLTTEHAKRQLEESQEAFNRIVGQQAEQQLAHAETKRALLEAETAHGELVKKNRAKHMIMDRDEEKAKNLALELALLQVRRLRVNQGCIRVNQLSYILSVFFSSLLYLLDRLPQRIKH